MLSQNNQFQARKMNQVSTMQFDNHPTYPIKPENYSQRVNQNKQAFAYNQ